MCVCLCFPAYNCGTLKGFNSPAAAAHQTIQEVAASQGLTWEEAAPHLHHRLIHGCSVVVCHATAFDRVVRESLCDSSARPLEGEVSERVRRV